MFGSAILDVAIGMVLVYLILSLVVTALQELIASLLKWRSETLCEGIRELLCDDKDQKEWTKKFYEHPLISALSKGPNGKPSYIPSRTFSLALLDLVHPAKAEEVRSIDSLRTSLQALPPQLQRTLTVLLDDAAHDVEKFKTAMETWFNNSMVRVAGWYKKKAQPVMLGLAAATAIFFNVDSLHVASVLAQDKTLRDLLVAQAQRVVKEPPTDLRPPAAPSEEPARDIGTASEGAASANAASGAVGARVLKTATTLEDLKLPIGWSDLATKDTGSRSKFVVWFNRGCGWLLTALAVSMGAPFWFDLLNKVMNIRAAGKAPEEKPAKPKEVPQPEAAGKSTGEGGTDK